VSTAANDGAGSFDAGDDTPAATVPGWIPIGPSADGDSANFNNEGILQDDRFIVDARRSVAGVNQARIVSEGVFCTSSQSRLLSINPNYFDNPDGGLDSILKDSAL
jgi:hypothetical protein